VSPTVQLQIQLIREFLPAHVTGVRTFAAAHTHMYRQRIFQKNVTTQIALHVFDLAPALRHVTTVVRVANVSRQARLVNEALATVCATLRLLIVYLLVPF
jgi:hypothetical protein